MRGKDVYEVLRYKGISSLHHANTVTTSCTFLRLGGLASRGHVADKGLPQTHQYTDPIDQRYGIWYEIFLDTVDIHARIRNRNLYGPVLFILGATVLRSLPAGSEIRVTKKNPTKWVDGEPDNARFFETTEELANGLSRGTFDQMIVISTPTTMLPFDAGSLQIFLDDPGASLPSGEGAFDYALSRLENARQGSQAYNIGRRICEAGCGCLQAYQRVDLKLYFG